MRKHFRSRFDTKKFGVIRDLSDIIRRWRGRAAQPERDALRLSNQRVSGFSVTIFQDTALIQHNSAQVELDEQMMPLVVSDVDSRLDNLRANLHVPNIDAK